ncbi:uncharacterized protein RAG0_10803 [Rhynchosporium agropyri]|uniref:Major facilitator superfamily (MFS) profile domain-containing protein n=1 Tax=Rhynchosporium agropyri TaxID=914238 RepID=A0A1E1L1D0_9HELO|nr:uncharacterized protein RAG0_10803 [Rhynchosporium agropyri]
MGSGVIFLRLETVYKLCNNGPLRAFDAYSPSITRGFGFAALSSNALAAVGLFFQIPVSFAFSWVSDRYNRRGETVIGGLSMHLVGYIFNRIFKEMHLRGPRYFGVVWTQIFGAFSSGLNIAWVSLACTDSGERALAMAMIIMAANIAGIYGAHILRADDAPRHRRGFGIDIAIIAFPVALASFRYIDDLRHRRRNSGQLTFEYSSDDIK